MDNLVIKKMWFIHNSPGNIEDSYEFEMKPIGTGAFGTVMKGRVKGQKSEESWRAIKKIPKKKVTDKVEFLNEIEILRKLDHPNIIKLYETFEDDRYIYMITELCTGGELFDKIIEKGFFSEEYARVIFTQMMLALNYCHKQGVAHRDLKPENFLFLNKEESSPIKLIDFGLSTRFGKEKKVEVMKTFVGTSYYMAPEVMKGIYDQSCDIWSAGVILYILVTGVPPFNGENDQEILKAVKTMQYSFDIPEMTKVSIALKELIAFMLVGPPKRPTSEQVLNHLWMIKGASTQPLPINLHRMRSFASYTKLKKIAVMMIATQLHQRDIFQLGKVFKSIDKNNDGELTIEEIRHSLMNHKDKPAMLEVQKILKNIDIDSSGKINYTEFIAGCMEHALIQKEENTLLAFKMMDSDRNGKITRQELQKIITEPTHEFNREAAEFVIKECDRNGDGMIDYNQFLDAMSKTS